MLNKVLFHLRITNCKTLEILNLELRKVVRSEKKPEHVTHLPVEGLPVWIMGIKNIQRTNFLVMYRYFPAI